MKKTIAKALSLAMVFGVLTGCTTAKPPAASGSPSATTAATSGAVKTGLAVISSTAKSTEAAADKAGNAQVDSTVVAVTVDGAGKIVKCVIDGVQTKIAFDAKGAITTDLKTVVDTKTELGEAYGMKKASGIGKEWSEQAQALAKYVEGKTVAEVKGIAVSAEGKPTAADLASSVTVSIGGYIAAIEKAVANAKELGAKATDKLGLGVYTDIAKSVNAGEAEGNAQAYSNYAVATFDASGKITSCYIDASQTDVKFSKEGKITSDINGTYQTKLEKGAAYGMAKASKIGKEWNEQAEAFAKYVTGKTVADVKGIAVNEKGAATAADLTSSVTVSITPFQTALEKAEKSAK